MAEKKKTAKKPAKIEKKQLPVIREQVPTEIISNLVLKGDIRGMSSDDRVKYYNHLCRSLGLNPLTQPFQILNLSGKEVLYATKTATEQLRKINGISVETIQQRVENGICITTVTVRDKTGRTDGAIGAVSVEGLKGDSLCNAWMKSETKAKRRATLSISGLGMLDESEIETIPNAKIIPVFTESTETFDEIKKKISDSINVKGLVSLGERIKHGNFSPDELSELRVIFTEKMNALTEVKK